jgi:large subunit ribosomal protein L24
MQTSNVKLSIRKNDQVEVISGREKGKTGKVLRVDAKSGRVLVEKVNMVKRHVKPSQQNPQGGILEKELPLHYSNVLLYCSKCNRGVRHGHKLVEGKKGAKGAEGKKQSKIRVCKRCNSTIEAAA